MSNLPTDAEMCALEEALLASPVDELTQRLRVVLARCRLMRVTLTVLSERVIKGDSEARTLAVAVVGGADVAAQVRPQKIATVRDLPVREVGRG